MLNIENMPPLLNSNLVILSRLPKQNEWMYYFTSESINAFGNKD